MAKPEWGVKRVCQSCAVKFYDLNRSPITCPKCAAPFDPEALLKSRRSRPAPAKVAKPEPAAGADMAAGKPPDADADMAAGNPSEADADMAAGKPPDADADMAAGNPSEADAEPDDAAAADGAAAGRPGDEEDDNSVLQDTSELGDDGVSEVVVTGDDDG